MARGKIFVTTLLLTPSTAWAQEPTAVAPQFEPVGAPSVAAIGGALKFTVSYVSDLNADAAGGRRTGAAYHGKAALLADVDLDRLIGVPGASGHISVIDIHGRGLSGHYVGNLATVSGIEAEPAIRLNQAWLQFAVGRRSSVKLRVGKFPAAQAFMASPTAGLFINATFGWPTSFAIDLPSGGPSWPLSAPGAMISSPIGAKLSARAAIFAGDPAGPGSADPQHRDRHGFNAFGFAGRPFMITEIDYATAVATFTVGGWVHLNHFADVRASFPSEALMQAEHASNLSAYAMVDGRLWTSHGTRGRSLNGFLRISFSPANRNPADLYVDGGVILKAPLRRRANDALGLAFARARISPLLVAADRRAMALGQPAAPLPRAETLIEANYSFAASG